MFENYTSFIKHLFMYFANIYIYKQKIETNMVKGHFSTTYFRPLDVSAPRRFSLSLFLFLSNSWRSETDQGVIKAETLIIIILYHSTLLTISLS